MSVSFESGPRYLPCTLLHALELASSDTQHGLIFCHDQSSYRRSWAELAHASRRAAAALSAEGVLAGSRVGILTADPEQFVHAFLGAMICRALPFAIGPSSLVTDEAAHRERVSAVLTSLDASHLVAGTGAFRTPIENAPLSSASIRVLSPGELSSSDARTPSPGEPAPDDLCYLQLTSGSTQTARAVAVSHRNLVANVEATHVLLGSRGQSEIGVSWLPLWHDMGLVSALLTPLLARTTQVVIPPQRFAASPRVWLEAVHRYDATITVATNFALHLALKRPPRSPGFNLRSLRTMLIGAEAINPEVLRAFAQRFAAFGLRPEALCPAYGMAEATLAISASDCERRPVTLNLVREAYERDERAVVGEANGTALEVVSCGRPLPGHRVVILDRSGHPVADGTVGQIAVAGPSVSIGYYTRSGIAPTPGADGLLHTGDRGFILDGELFVSGRIKELIIIAGRNLHPQLIEWHVGRIDGMRSNAVAAFSVPGEDTERLVIAAEHESPRDAQALHGRIRSCIAREFGLPVADIVVLRPWTLPKTSSGKLQRAQLRDRYLRGDLR